MCFWQENILNGVPETVGTATEVIASISTRIAPVLLSNSLKIGLTKSICKFKKKWNDPKTVSLRSKCFGIWWIATNVLQYNSGWLKSQEFIPR
jgi:hypothetical protein